MSHSAEPSATAAVPGAAQVFALAWPMTLKALALQATVVIDGWLVSSLGETSLAAMGLAAALGGMILGVIFAFSAAMQIRAAQVFGAGSPVLRKSVLASGLALGLAIGLAGILALFLFGPSLLEALAPSRDIADISWTYLSIFTLVILGESLGQTIASHFNGCGRTKLPLIGYCLSLPINVASSYALIHGAFGLPALGVAGAAMGSALGVMAQTLFFAALLLRLERHLAAVPGWAGGRFGRALSAHALFALPIAATFVSASLASHTCTLIYAKLALPAFAALTLIVPWNMVAGAISMQWAQATGILVAQLLGRQTAQADLELFLSRAWRGAFVAAALVAAMFVVLTLSVDRLYPDLAPETRGILVSFLPILVLMQFPRATNAICGNTLRASGDTVYVMHIFLWSQWAFRVPATALAVPWFDLPPFWILALFLGEELLKFPAFHLRVWRGDWKRGERLRSEVASA